MSRANMAAWVADGKVHVAAARVEAWDGEAQHYETNEEGDIVVHCKMHDAGTPLKANLGPMAGSRGAGVWLIPDAGTEVVVASNNGDFEGELYLIGMHPSGSSPANLTPGKVLVIGTTVEVRSFDGVPEKGPKFETFRQAEDERLNALSSALSAVVATLTAIAAAATALATSSTALGTPPQQAASSTAATALAAAASAAIATVTAAVTAIGTFQGGAPSYLATVLKNE